MSLRLEPWAAGSIERWRSLVADASLQPEFELLLGGGLEGAMGDAYNVEASRRVARLDGADVGISFSFLLPTAGTPFAATRVGVLARARRRGVGSALLAEATRIVRERAPECREQVLSAFVPNPAAEAFATRHGFAPSRRYWLMERAAGAPPAPTWPDGVEISLLPCDDAGIARWVEVFNRSWREQDHGVLATEADVRRQLASGTVQPEGVFVALHRGEAVGFVRGARHATRGEIAVIGVVPEWRGRGLGRALLRFGTRWLLDHGFEPVSLLVDGTNERALRLYRGEGFEVARTRQVWSRSL